MAHWGSSVAYRRVTWDVLGCSCLGGPLGDLEGREDHFAVGEA